MFKTLGPGLLVDDYRGIIHDSTTQIHTIYRISRGWSSHPWESLKKPVSGPRYLADQRVQRVQRKVRLGVTAVEVRYRLPWLFFWFRPMSWKMLHFFTGHTMFAILTILMVAWWTWRKTNESWFWGPPRPCEPVLRRLCSTEWRVAVWHCLNDAHNAGYVGGIASITRTSCNSCLQQSLCRRRTLDLHFVLHSVVLSCWMLIGTKAPSK